MQRYALSFAAGILAAAMTFKTGHAVALIALGALTAALVICGAIGSTRRLRRVAAGLVAVAELVEGKCTAKRSTPAAIEPEDPRERDLISALKNFGETAAKARTIARHAIENSPASATFQDVFRFAMASRKAAA